MPPGRRGEGTSLDHRQLERATREALDEELLRECRRLLAHDPHHHPAHDGGPMRRRAPRARADLLVARLAYEAELPDRALHAARAALAKSPGDPDALRLLAAIQHRRGRLSEAVSAWEELGEREAPARSGLRHLGLVYELAAWEAAGRVRPLPEGLEEALAGSLPDLTQSCRAALVDDLPGALRAVDRVLARFQGRDPHVYKIAAIQRAWLLERAHDVQGAIAVLERLADEPRLANDVERLLCLSVLYEREGTPERLRRAVRAVRYAYLTTREPMLLRRLGRLLRALGYPALADEFEARFLSAFLRRHGTLSPRELARAVAASYVPLGRLGRLPPPRAGAESQMVRHAARARTEHRRRAAALALCLGEIEQAASLLRGLDAAGAATATDLLYLADVEAQLGEPRRAKELRLRAIAGAPDLDAAALLTLSPPDASLDDEAFDALGHGERLERRASSLRRWVEAQPGSAEGWLMLSEVERALGRAARARDHEARALALREVSAAPPVPVSLAAAALRRGGEVHGLIHELWVERRPGDRGGLEADDVLGSVSPELRATAVNVFYSVRAFVRARFPHRARAIESARYLLKVTKDDELSSGDSVGLPIAIAFLAAFLDLPVPADVASTGAIVCDARDAIVVRRVGDVEAKVVGAYERRLRRILLPADNEGDVERAERVPPAVAAELVGYVSTLEDVLAELFPDLV